ncbi:DNA polymerase IV [Marinibactrum halimedae]|uniref:DNA polymerase IV n=1 Tax=Marinibactrum halimedae TaxID=1444977 RepID=A0AA37T2G9_9GAMM|nr:DNA polymerase IV [Marinibactrum halimedae]MCD9459907.1 DNA polymerase IV [Marinibactrum halimedae]GLS25238.1 DNA polymerase IV [Marinibactrum halimedae]
MKENRKIIHCDADCFYAAIEMRERPELANYPIAVGGSSDRRGVISTCNYLARKFGVRSAMATATAKRLCPHLVVLPSRMPLYKEASDEIREIFSEFTSLIEPLSLDEAYLDVTQTASRNMNAVSIAKEIRKRVERQIRITISAGVAPNKFLAKVASDWRKPDGLTVIHPEQLLEFVKQLPVSRIPGVGSSTQQVLMSHGVFYCGQLQEWPLEKLIQLFGEQGRKLYERSRGRDDRLVVSQWRRKSVSVERTFSMDLESIQQCDKELPLLLDWLIQRWQRLDNSYAIHKLAVKVKYADFHRVSAERVLEIGESPTEGFTPLAQQELLDVFQLLLKDIWLRRTAPVRLLGVGFGLKDVNHQFSVQQDLFV